MSAGRCYIEAGWLSSLIATACLLLPGCASYRAQESAESIFFDLRGTNALELLDALKASTIGFVTVEPTDNWVQDEDLPDLVALLDSEQRCASVQSVYSSRADSWSTVGNEAAFLVRGYIEGRYPPDLNSTMPVQDKEAIRLWWNERSDEE